MSEVIVPDSRETLVQKQLKNLGDPEHEDKLRAIRTQTMLAELMSSDPIISGYSPSEVMEGYNNLAETLVSIVPCRQDQLKCRE
jgi:hypothetical protein